MEAAIFGAGPCGLTAAWELVKRGVKVTVVEKDSTVGGLCKTVTGGGYQFDLGGHRFISKDRELVEDIKTLMGGRLLVRDRKSVILFKDRRFDYPINLPNVLSQSTLLMSFRFAGGYIRSCLGFTKSEAPEGSFEAWIDKRFGGPLNEYFFKPYTEKLWGIDMSRLSDDWAGQRISLLDAKDAVIKAFGFTKNKPRTYAAGYLYPKGGIGEIFELMADEIRRMGGQIILGFRPVRFKTSGSNVIRAEIENKNGERRVVKADEYLSTIPLDEAARLLGRGSNAPLPYRSLRFLNITLDGIENLSDNTWIYTPEADVMMTRIQEPKRRSPFSAPPGKTSVMLEIPCQRDDRVWSMPDDELLETALGHLRVLGFDLRGNVAGVFSTYAGHAYPRGEMGLQSSVRYLRGVAERFDNMKTAGRQGLFKYIFMDTAMLMGRQWAKNLVDGKRHERIDEIHNTPDVLETESVAV